MFRVDVVTGRRTHWKTLTPSDPVGVEVDRASVVVAADGSAYCYSFSRRLGDLFVADGLQMSEQYRFGDFVLDLDARELRRASS